MNRTTRTSIIGAIAIIFAASLWGLDGVVLRPSLYHLDVPVVVFTEHFIAFFFMMIFVVFGLVLSKSYLKKDFKEFRTLKSKDWLSFFWIALFGGAIGTMAITKALFHVNFEHLSAIIILQKLQPLFAICLAIIILKERPRKIFYLWALLALFGSYLITFGFHAPVFAGNKLFIASLLSLLAAFSWGSSTVFGKRVVNIVNFRTATYIRFGLTSLVMLAIIAFYTLATGTNHFAGFDAITAKELVVILIIAFTTGGTAIFIYYYGLKRTTASRATIYELGFPVTAVALDYVVHGNIMSLGQWLGAMLIIGSMIKITQLKKTQS